MSRTRFTVFFTPDEFSAIQAAITGGAFAQRQAQLTELLRLNHGHLSIANSIEREIEALTRASAGIVTATPD